VTFQGTSAHLLCGRWKWCVWVTACGQYPGRSSCATSRSRQSGGLRGARQPTGVGCRAGHQDKAPLQRSHLATPASAREIWSAPSASRRDRSTRPSGL